MFTQSACLLTARATIWKAVTTDLDTMRRGIRDEDDHFGGIVAPGSIVRIVETVRLRLRSVALLP